MEKKFIVFNLADQKYCIDIVDISEIILYQNTIDLPNTPPFVEGLINLRGDVVSVISLAKRLGKTSNVEKENQKIIMTSNSGLNLGFLVDDVSEMITAEDSEITPPPAIVCSQNTTYMNGVINKNDHMYLIIDISHLLSDMEISQLGDMMDKNDLK